MPTRSEINIAPPQPQQPVQNPANVDLEQGRIEPTLKANKISSRLPKTREQRENKLLRTLTRTAGLSTSNLRRGPSSVAPLSPPSEAIKEEDDMGLQPLDPKEGEHVGGRQEERTTPPQHYFPDDARSAITEHEQKGDLDGDWI